jgi:pSer/pThr/pTyr-binding forkhead associated (FHA) protein
VRCCARGAGEEIMGANGSQSLEAVADRAVPAGAAVRVMRGFYEGLDLPLDRDWLVVGRGRGADMVIHEPTISRAHAAVGFREGAFFVQDLGSTNGTFLNGSRRERARLSDGDEIQMGRLLLRVRVPD